MRRPYPRRRSAKPPILPIIRDPIQIRTQIRFMQIKDDDTRTDGFDWSNGGTGPTITLGFGTAAGAAAAPFNLIPNPFNEPNSYAHWTGL